MAVGFSEAECNGYTDDSIAKGTWIKLHVGDPGAAGTANPATETERVEASFAAADNGVATTDSATEWTDVAAAEDYTHFTRWTASSGGTFLGSGTVTANPVSMGDSLIFAAGALTVGITPAS